MPAPKKKQKVVKAKEIPSNNEEKKPVIPKKPETQAEFYIHAHTVILNKLPKEERDHLLRNLEREELLIRGEKVIYQNVRNFVKQVAELGESLFDKSIKAKLVAAQVIKSEK